MKPPRRCPRALPILCASILAACSDAGGSFDGSIAGVWQGFGSDPLNGRTRVELFLTETEGGFEGHADLRELGVVQLAVEGTVSPEGRVSGAFPLDIGTFEGTVDGEVLTVVLDVQAFGPSDPLTLRRDDPEFAAFRAPRLDADGERELGYHYRAPAATADGWPVSTLADEGLDEGPIVELVEAILAGDYPHTDGLLIVRNGKLVLEEYFYGNASDRAHVIASCTKSVTSLLVGQAIDAGWIVDVDQPVAGFFPDYEDTAWIAEPYDIRLREVLSMTAGLSWNEDVPYTDLDNSAIRLALSPDPFRFVLDTPRDSEPGAEFEYNSGLSLLLGGVLAAATGETVADWAEHELFDPLGIETYAWATETANRDTGGGLRLLVRDMAKIGQLVVQAGQWNGVQVVPASWIEESTAAQAPGAFYGYQWWRAPAPIAGETVDGIAAVGYGAQQISIAPAAALVVVHTGLDFEGRGANPTDQIVRYVLPAVNE